ncbi:MAG: hypothetical protein KC910_21310, partial [Candidatus Eremiobacteraeota bacterium]|nr:hypothetical protein [Candidatus Eremiobacteraeota bacterium]
RKSELDEARARLDALRGQLDGQRAALLERSGRLSQGLAELEQQRVTFHRLEGEVVQHEARASVLLDRIAELVQPVPVYG